MTGGSAEEGTMVMVHKNAGVEPARIAVPAGVAGSILFHIFVGRGIESTFLWLGVQSAILVAIAVPLYRYAARKNGAKAEELERQYRENLRAEQDRKLSEFKAKQDVGTQ